MVKTCFWWKFFFNQSCIYENFCGEFLIRLILIFSWKFFWDEFFSTEYFWEFKEFFCGENFFWWILFLTKIFKKLFGELGEVNFFYNIFMKFYFKFLKWQTFLWLKIPWFILVTFFYLGQNLYFSKTNSKTSIFFFETKTLKNFLMRK